MLIASIEGANFLLKGDGDTVADLRVIRTEDGRFISAWIGRPLRQLPTRPMPAGC